MDECHNGRHDSIGLNSRRAGCAETRSSGSEGGSRKPNDGNAATAPRSDPYIVGRDMKSAIGTLVERKTRFLMLLHLPDGRTAEHVRQALTKQIIELPAALRNSLTWDQGTELAQHTHFTIDTGVSVYFCDAHSPWQRGSNENTGSTSRRARASATSPSINSTRLQTASTEDHERRTVGDHRQRSMLRPLR